MVGTMAFLANVEPPEVGCDSHAGPCPALPVKGELGEMHKAGCLAKHEPERPALGDWSSPSRRTKGDSGWSLRKQRDPPLPCHTCPKSSPPPPDGVSTLRGVALGEREGLPLCSGHLEHGQPSGLENGGTPTEGAFA